jgi:hypothetical protein
MYDEDLTQPYVPRGTSPPVLLEIVRECLPELQSYTLAHYTNTVDRVDQGLDISLD